MNWTDVKNLIGSAAPVLGTAIGGPAGAAIGSIVSSALGVENTPDAISSAIKSDPEAMAKLKKIELDNVVDLRSSVLKMADLELKDKQDARANNKHSIMPALICCFLTVAVVAFAGCLLFITVPEGNVRLIDTLFGSFLTAWLGSVCYWTGTSRGSAEKTKAIMK